MEAAKVEELTVIGIGSSAGGLEALRELVANLPNNQPVAYVIVQHMSPHHKSLMSELIGRQTELKVTEIVDGTVPEHNVIYITPPKADIIYADGMLKLVEPSIEAASPKPSVDRFLMSLAEHKGERAVAVILSGTGTDGAYGIQAIREAGGITIAQDSETAKYDGMPGAAVQTGCIDMILSPHDIGAHLEKILTSPRDFSMFRQSREDAAPVEELLQILLARTRVDFSEYKISTVNRRISRRMVALGIEGIDEYTQHCRANPQAVDDLFKDLLISVTRFFRDKTEFDLIADLLPELLANHTTSPIRVWIAGCATGEEAYTVAILLAEALGGPTKQLSDYVQIYATDIDKEALGVARRGVYNATALNDIPPDLAAKYFIHDADSIRVVDTLRSAVLFSEHNVCQAPPFQRIDLLCCRNLLIYFGIGLQRKVMARFNYSMTEHSLLLLGTSENVSGSDELFTPHASSNHIFRKRFLRRPSIPNYARTDSSVMLPPRRAGKKPDQAFSTDRKMFEALAQSLGRDSLLVTNDYAIVRIYGNVSTYIEMSEASNLKMQLDLLRSPFREEARTLITFALKNGERRVGLGHALSEESDTETRLVVYPIVAKELNERVALVVFEEYEPEPASRAQIIDDSTLDGDVSARIRYLEAELTSTRDALQLTIQELETSNEELQSLSEEMQSTNEELQATNEELETSNEELQSTNEELITVNEELQVTAAELSGRTGELISVLETAPLAILVLDTALQVTQATNAATDLFALERPISALHISQCAVPAGYPTLAPLCNEALTAGAAKSYEFSSKGTRVKMMCSPFFDIRGKVKGVTMVIAEFPGMALELDLLLNNTQIYMMNRAHDGTILRISERSARALGMTRNQAEGQNFYEISSDTLAQQVREQDAEALTSTSKHSIHLVRGPNPDGGGEIWLNTERHVYKHPSVSEPTVYAVATDVSAMVDAQRRAEEGADQLILLQNLAQTGYWSLDLETGVVYWSDEVYRIHGEDPKSYIPNVETAVNFYHPEDREKVQNHIETVARKGGEFRFTHRLIRRDGRTMIVECIGMAKVDKAGDIKRVIGVFKSL